MRKLPIFLIMIMVFMMSSISLKANVIDPEKQDGSDICGPSLITDNDPPQDVYWYFIKIKIDPKTRQIEIVQGKPTVNVGSMKSFEKAIWKGIQRRQVCIGPFQSDAEALNSRIYYKKSADKINELPQGTAPSEMAWFPVSLVELKRMGSFEFERKPSAVNYGSANEFVGSLYEALGAHLLMVGPFWDGIWAEKAKAIYRMNE